jgi:hypothetical protein
MACILSWDKRPEREHKYLILSSVGFMKAMELYLQYLFIAWSLINARATLNVTFAFMIIYSIYICSSKGIYVCLSLFVCYFSN